LVNFVYNIPRTTMIAVDLLTYLRDGILRPLVCVAPLFFLLAVKWLIPSLIGVMESGLSLVAAFSTLVVFWTFGLTGGQRGRVLSVLGLAGR